ncbi:hypothetical protein [Streptomyces sp. G-G2]|nr:hypothetical protein [Streptomyces sp. G-G2]MDJ0383080.1 hypothetical protein [Streptomyces sp. G-G2]
MGLTTFVTLAQSDVRVTDALPPGEATAVAERGGEVVLAAGRAGGPRA